jgi:hypothetical protein
VTKNAAFSKRKNTTNCTNASSEREPLSHHCPIELAVAKNTLFALPPINGVVPTTNTKTTASGLELIAVHPNLFKSGRATDVLSRPSAETQKPAESLNVVPPPNYILDICVSSLRLDLCAAGHLARGKPASSYTEFCYCADTADLCCHKAGAW